MKYKDLGSYFVKQNGNTATFFALLAVPMVAFVGGGVDFAMAMDVKANVQASLDSAVLAGAAKLSHGVTAAVLEADNFYANNVSTLASTTASFSVSNNIVSGTATGTYKTFLLSVIGIHDVPISATSAATRSVGASNFKGAEIAIVVDVSGSMIDSIPSLRNATTNILDALYESSETKTDLWVSIIPFSGRVNITNYGKDWFNTGQIPTANIPPTTGSPNVTINAANECSVNTYATSAPRLCGARRSGDSQWNSDTHFDQPWNFYTGPVVTCPLPRVIGLESHRSTLQQAADNLCAGNGTSTHEGMAWAYRALDPSWRGQWGSATLPLDYDESPAKIAIIMTDGVNHPNQADDPITADEADEELLKTCTEMKSKGIIIYAVTYNMGGSLQALYAQCTTKPEYSFTSEDGEELEETFSLIGDMVINGSDAGDLRLIH